MRQTKNYNLKLIDTDDQFSPDALNENAEALDAELARVNAALSVKAEQTELVRVETEAARVYVGSYFGNGERTQKINLGFTPKAVLVITMYGEVDYNGFCYGGLALEGKPLHSSIGTEEVALEIVSGGMEAHQIDSGTRVETNQAGMTYYYIAFK